MISVHLTVTGPLVPADIERLETTFLEMLNDLRKGNSKNLHRMVVQVGDKTED